MAKTEYKAILYEVKDRVALITLNRPDKMNAINTQMLTELEDAMKKVADDPDIRVVVWTGAGVNFNAGGDLEEFKDASPMFMANFNGRVMNLYRFMLRMGKPTIAAVNGFCVMDMINAFDLIVAADNARFGNPEIGVGIQPGAGITAFLPRWVGSTRRALQLLFFPDPISAWEAQRLGIVNWVVPADKLLEEALRIAKRLADSAPLALAAIKKSVLSGMDMPLDESMDFQLANQLPLFHTEDQKEGMRAFLERRKPVFKGK